MFEKTSQIANAWSIDEHTVCDLDLLAMTPRNGIIVVLGTSLSLLVLAAAIWLALVQSWFTWHDAKHETDMVVDEALNAVGGAEYPKALDILWKLGRPQSVIDLQIGVAIVGSFKNSRKIKVRPAETLSEGFALLEKAVLGGGEGQEVAPQQLRMIFERGIGEPPKQAMKPIREIAACRLAVEEDRPEDPRRCIVLRKQRLNN